MKPSTPFVIDSSLLKQAADRVSMRCDTMAKHSEATDSLARTFCSDAMKGAHDELRNWMQSAGMSCRLDAVGNLIGEFRSSQGMSKHDDQNDGQRDVLMIGSHVDTVFFAGKFDGTLGVLLGLGVVEILKEAKIELNFDVQLDRWESWGISIRETSIGWMQKTSV